MGRTPGPDQGPRGPWPAVPVPAVRALVPALLALPHAADVLRAAVLVHPHDQGPGRTPAGERGDQLVPRAHQARPLRRLAEQQHRLGAVALAVLGHATAAVAVPERPRDRDQLAGRAGRPGRPGPVGPGSAPPLHRRDHLRLPRAGLPARAGQQGEVRGHLPGAVHLRGRRPDPRLVLHADGGRDTRVRQVLVRKRRLPRPHHRRGRPEDEQAPGQRPVAHPADGRPWRGRPALVHGVLGVAPVPAAGRRRVTGGDRPEGLDDLLEHRVVLLPLRRPHRVEPAVGRPGRSATAARPVDPRRGTRLGRRCGRPAGELRHGRCRPAAGGVRRRPVQLVRAPQPAAVLQWRPGRARHPLRDGRNPHPAAGPDRAVHHGGGVAAGRPPRRRGRSRVGPPVRLAHPGRRPARCEADGAGQGGTGPRGGRPRRAEGEQDPDPPAAGSRPRRVACRDRGARRTAGRRRRRAERQASGIAGIQRHGDRRDHQAQLPGAGQALRQPDPGHRQGDRGRSAWTAGRTAARRGRRDGHGRRRAGRGRPGRRARDRGTADGLDREFPAWGHDRPRHPAHARAEGRGSGSRCRPGYPTGPPRGRVRRLRPYRRVGHRWRRGVGGRAVARGLRQAGNVGPTRWR